MMMWYGGNAWGWAGGILMAVGMVAFWTLVITTVVLAVRYLTGSRGTAGATPGAGRSRAADLLAERLARGQIDENEYRLRLALLREH